MEPWQVVFITMYGGILAYLSITSIQQGKKIVMLQGIDKKIDENKLDMDHKMEGLKVDISKMNGRFDTFIKNEMDFLKDLSKRE